MRWATWSIRKRNMKATSTLSAFAALNRKGKAGRVVFSRNGDAYAVSNGAIELRGELCGERLVRSIIAKGRDCGCLDALLRVEAGGGVQWPGVKSLCSVSFTEVHGVGVLNLIGEWWQVVGSWSIPGFAFRVHVRLTLRPGEPFFLAEIAELRNSGTKELRIGRTFLSVLPPSGVAPVCVRKPSDAENAAAWDAGGGMSIGLRSEDEGVQRLSFWVDSKSQCPHADCGFEPLNGQDIVLPPSGSIMPPRPMSAIVFIAGATREYAL